MTKNKNAELKENYPTLKRIKEVKIKKNKQANIKNHNDVVDKTKDLKLAPKKQSSNFKKNVDVGDITKNLQKVAKNKKGKQGVQKKQKELKDIENTLVNKPPSEEKTQAELKKIEKKKAKKLAQKLKKQQKKAQNKNSKKATPSSEQNDSNSCLGEKVKKSVNEDLNKKHVVLTNGEQKTQKLETTNNKNGSAASSKVLTKKVKKAKGQLIKDQKLGTANDDPTSSKVLTKEATKAKKGHLLKEQEITTADNKTIDTTSSKVLIKKQSKALKRQLIKDQKLAEKQTRDPALEEATVFVGNLPVNTKRIQLQRIFNNVGPVNCIRLRSAGGKVLLKHKQRKLAGSLNAYVVLQSKEKAEKALALNGVDFKGNHLRVTLATQKPESHDNGEAKRTVFVGNLKYSASEETLREIFSSCGEIEYVRCIRDGDKGCKGVAYVCFKTADAVGLALELNETILDERALHVERFNVKKLGAKKARETQAEKESKSKSGAKLRLEGKKNKKEKSSHKLPNQGEIDDAKKSKKSEFRGVKVEGLKKKPKSKKKKSNDQMLQLAKKIAPKSKD